MKAGDIVWVQFPYEGAKADKSHPAIVLDDLEDGRYLLAYGSSKRVDAASPLPNEVVVSDQADLRECGLRVPTRFDLGIRAALALSGSEHSSFT